MDHGSLFFLLLVLLTVPTEGSYCMSTDCTNTGLGGLSLYLRVCCVVSNLGQSVTIREPGANKYILCPKVRPKPCPDISDCKSLFEDGNNASDIYTISPDGGTPFEVYCDMETDGGGWAVFQRRQDGSVDFYRNWTDYMNGFGNLTGEFWLGLSKIYRLTKERSNTLRVELQEFNNDTRVFAEFSRFNIGDNSTEYTLSVGDYSDGTAQDSLYLHDGMRFSTRDDDNDLGPDYSCAISHTGAWWYRGCHVACLNGRYFQNPVSTADGIVWYEYNKNYVVFRFSEMKTRRNN